MNDSLTNRRYTPKLVIVVYADKQRNYYLERSAIGNVNGKPTVLAPVPMDEDALKDIAKSYMKNNTFEMNVGGWMAPHLLYGVSNPGNTVVMWYRPAMKCNLNFSTALGMKGVDVASNTVAEVPATLYVVKNNELFVFALMSDARPTAKTKLYQAPFFNIYTNGRVCLGSAKVGNQKAKTFELEAERYERGFYMAEQNGGQSGNACKTPLVTLWPRLIKTKAKFPSKEQLKQHKQYKTVGELMTKLFKDNNHGSEDEDDE
jgi:PRTRC genetic system protein B